MQSLALFRHVSCSQQGRNVKKVNRGTIWTQEELLLVTLTFAGIFRIKLTFSLLLGSSSCLCIWRETNYIQVKLSYSMFAGNIIHFKHYAGIYCRRNIVKKSQILHSFLYISNSFKLRLERL